MPNDPPDRTNGYMPAPFLGVRGHLGHIRKSTLTVALALLLSCCHVAPVTIQTEPPTPYDKVQASDKYCLALSGGGYRAMIFHLGTLEALNERGLLNRIDRISTVSGGSYVAAILAKNYSKLAVAGEFSRRVVEPTIVLAQTTIDTPAFWRGVVDLGQSASNKLIGILDKDFLDHSTLDDLGSDDLPTDGYRTPDVWFNAVSMVTAESWTFTTRPPRLLGTDSGEVDGLSRFQMSFASPVPAAVAAASSSAFPPWLAPVELSANHLPLQEGKSLLLMDGGVKDNSGVLGCSGHEWVLVSDAGFGGIGAAKPPGKFVRTWLGTALSASNAMYATKERMMFRDLWSTLNSEYFSGTSPSVTSAMWSMSRPRPAVLKDQNFWDSPLGRGMKWASSNASTRLARMSSEQVNTLFNVGYLTACDALNESLAGLSSPPTTCSAPRAWPNDFEKLGDYP